jgi:hypothetical protein
MRRQTGTAYAQASDLAGESFLQNEPEGSRSDSVVSGTNRPAVEWPPGIP